MQRLEELHWQRVDLLRSVQEALAAVDIARRELHDASVRERQVNISSTTKPAVAEATSIAAPPTKHGESAETVADQCEGPFSAVRSNQEAVAVATLPPPQVEPPTPHLTDTSDVPRRSKSDSLSVNSEKRPGSGRPGSSSLRSRRRLESIDAEGTKTRVVEVAPVASFTAIEDEDDLQASGNIKKTLSRLESRRGQVFTCLPPPGMFGGGGDGSGDSPKDSSSSSGSDSEVEVMPTDSAPAGAPVAHGTPHKSPIHGATVVPASRDVSNGSVDDIECGTDPLHAESIPSADVTNVTPGVEAATIEGAKVSECEPLSLPFLSEELVFLTALPLPLQLHVVIESDRRKALHRQFEHERRLIEAVLGTEAQCAATDVSALSSASPLKVSGTGSAPQSPPPVGLSTTSSPTPSPRSAPRPTSAMQLFAGHPTSRPGSSRTNLVLRDAADVTPRTPSGRSSMLRSSSVQTITMQERLARTQLTSEEEVQFLRLVAEAKKQRERLVLATVKQQQMCNEEKEAARRQQQQQQISQAPPMLKAAYLSNNIVALEAPSESSTNCPQRPDRDDHVPSNEQQECSVDNKKATDNYEAPTVSSTLVGPRVAPTPPKVARVPSAREKKLLSAIQSTIAMEEYERNSFAYFGLAIPRLLHDEIQERVLLLKQQRQQLVYNVLQECLESIKERIDELEEEARAAGPLAFTSDAYDAACRRAEEVKHLVKLQSTFFSAVWFSVALKSNGQHSYPLGVERPVSPIPAHHHTSLSTMQLQRLNPADAPQHFSPGVLEPKRPSIADRVSRFDHMRRSLTSRLSFPNKTSYSGSSQRENSFASSRGAEGSRLSNYASGLSPEGSGESACSHEAKSEA